MRRRFFLKEDVCKSRLFNFRIFPDFQYQIAKISDEFYTKDSTPSKYTANNMYRR